MATVSDSQDDRARRCLDSVLTVRVDTAQSGEPELIPTVSYGGRIVTRMPGMQVHLPDELYRRVQQEGLPVSEILQEALREELARREKLVAIDEYIKDLVAEVRGPTAEEYARAKRLTTQICGEADRLHQWPPKNHSLAEGRSSEM